MINLTLQEKEQLGSVLMRLADSIDLTETQYKLAIDKYTTVGNYLSGSNSLLNPFTPSIRPQGSIRTGTAVRPIHEDSEFDVDLTCVLQLSLPYIQFDLKELVRRQLNASEVYKHMLDEMRRCWRLKYAESSKFHLDIVPAIPDSYQWLLNLGVPLSYAQHAICITDNEHSHYKINSYEFPKSNTEGYAIWFLDIMKVEADKIRMELKSKLLLERVEDVPDYKVRTPLQRGVQLMKRHRDIMFEGKDDCPISIIITTLAARAYEYVIKNNFTTVFYDVIVRMVEMMPQFIQNRNGIKWVENPVNPLENFADKWRTNKIKEQNFYQWHTAFLGSLRSNRIMKGAEEMGNHLKETYGTRAVNEALNSMGKNALFLRESGQLKATSAGVIGSIGTLVKPHTFDGNE
jgi:hypothetical protein